MQLFRTSSILSWLVAVCFSCCPRMGQAASSKGPEGPGPSSRATSLVISEIMYHPANRTDGRKQSFVELYNAGPYPEEITGYRLSGDIAFTFPTKTLQPGQYLVVADKLSDFLVIYPWVTNALGNFTGDLLDNGGNVRLRNRSDAILLDVTYDTDPPWPLLADGKGYSLVLTRPSFGQSDPRAWSASAGLGGSPGSADPSSLNPLRNVVINEFLAYSVLPELDFIELYNRSVQDLDLSGCSLSDNPDTNKFTFQGATIAAGSYLALDEFSLGFSLKAEGDTIYFRAPSGAILDVARYGPQAAGISQGRVPEGGPEFFPLSPSTPFAINNTLYSGDIVINEIMYAPISHDSDDEFIELHNRSTNAVDVSGWQFTDGITFTIPPQTIIPSNGYLVVAHDATHLKANYPNLSSANTVGNYSGSLDDNGERLALSRPEPLVQSKVTNYIYVVVDEVTYGTGGRWGRWARGGGSSLELLDPHSENRFAANWADSDENAKASWTTIEVTGTLDNGFSIPGNSELFIMLLGAGECLIDDVQVFVPWTPNNLVSNASFNISAAGWVALGNHERSSWSSENSGSFHLRASGVGHPVGNCVKTALPLNLSSGTATLRARARWLCGQPQLLLRLSGNYLEAAGALPVPENLGTPGQRNSRSVANAGPAIFEVQHDPLLPAANQPVLVTAQLHDPDGFQAFLHYRIDPNTTFNTVAMTDDGAGGDLVAADGIYSATIPGQAAGVLVACYIDANDLAPTPAVSRFPADPDQEFLIRFGDAPATGSFSAYRIWMSRRNLDRWTVRDPFSDEPLDCTLIYGTNRVIYNASIRYGGDIPSRTNFTSPFAARSAYLVSFGADDLLHGSTELLLEPVDPNNDSTALRERTAIWMAEQLGLPFGYQRFVRVLLNGVHNTNRGIPIFIDRQLPNAAYLESWFSADSGGELFEATLWLEPLPPPNSPFVNIQPARLLNYTTTGAAKKQARYRATWPKRENVFLDDDDTRLFQLVDVLNNTNSTYSEQVTATVDLEEWLGALAFRHVVADGDGYGYLQGRNQFIYKGDGQKWKILLGRLTKSLGSAGVGGGIL